MKKFIITVAFIIFCTMNVFAADTLDSNKYFEVTEKYEYVDCIDYTHLIWVINPKQTESISITGIAYDSSNNVIDKISSAVNCVKGEENFIEFAIDNYNKISKIDWKYKVDTNPWLHTSSEDDSIIVEKYNKVEDDIYITVKQVKEKYGCFAELKMLFFNNGKVIDSEDGFFMIYAENLDGINSTDVMDFWIYGTAYDDVKFYYEWY